MIQTSLSCFRNRPDQTAKYLTAVSLHSHTNYSKESLQFIPKFAEKYPILRWALERQCKKSMLPVDFDRAYWTPPLTAKLSHEVESGQIENVLGLASLVSLTDHDNIEAPTLLRALPETGDVPFALEWSVPHGGAVFHLGVHNLPDRRAVEMTSELAAYTRFPCDHRLNELLAMLDQCPEILIVFNHPLWDLGEVGPCYGQLVDQFLERHAGFVHALEINATRSWKENIRVIELAERLHLPIVSGGDRHGCEPSGALNLTRAESFPEFVAEVRLKQRSHVLLMPQYAEPRCIHIARELLDTIRDYPEYPIGSRRWDNRVFHPGRTANEHCALSTLWKAPPAFIEVVFSALSLLENAMVRRALTHVMADEAHARVLSEVGYEATW
jgi:hypothetical protein